MAEVPTDAGLDGAWEHVAPGGQQFTIRQAVNLDELEQCIAMQQQTWGYSDLEVVPRNIYVLAQALGGHVLVACDAAGGFAGFAMAVAAHEPASVNGAAQEVAGEGWMQPVGSRRQGRGEPGRCERPAPTPYLHSHLVAVAPEHRSSGLGRALKFAQRDLALSAGLRWMRWTFDPMMARNAVFNLNRLGATVRRYIPNFYGMLSSLLQGGLPTDRLLAEWDLTGPRAEAAREGRMAPPEPAESIALSPDVPSWKQTGRTDALRAVQDTLREQFTDAFSRGLRLDWFAPDDSGGGRYLLSPAEPAIRPHHAPSRIPDGAGDLRTRL